MRNFSLIMLETAAILTIDSWKCFTWSQTNDITHVNCDGITNIGDDDDDCETVTQHVSCGWVGSAYTMPAVAGLPHTRPTCRALGPWTDSECWCRYLLSGTRRRRSRPWPRDPRRCASRAPPPGWPRPSPTWSWCPPACTCSSQFYGHHYFTSTQVAPNWSPATRSGGSGRERAQVRPGRRQPVPGHIQPPVSQHLSQVWLSYSSENSVQVSAGLSSLKQELFLTIWRCARCLTTGGWDQAGYNCLICRNVTSYYNRLQLVSNISMQNSENNFTNNSKNDTLFFIVINNLLWIWWNRKNCQWNIFIIFVCVENQETFNCKQGIKIKHI